MNVRSLLLLNVLALSAVMTGVWYELGGDVETVNALLAWLALMTMGFLLEHIYLGLCKGERPFTLPKQVITQTHVITYVRVCPHCGEEQPTGDRCQQCAKHRAIPISYYKELESRYQERQQYCFSCGADYPPDATFCIGCGKPTPNTGKTRAL